ncbi:MAG: enoyl-CoA hydratase-related protein [Gemmatimonadota bacterium]
MSAQFIRTSIANGVGTLTLNRPDRLNAVDDVMAREVLEGAGDLLDDAGVRVLVITGEGRAFSAGGDVKFLGNALRNREYDRALSLVKMGGDLVRLLRSAPKPVLASLNGIAAGGGANLALACDLRIASDRAGIGEVFHRIGLHVDWGGTYFLPELLGPSQALEVIWESDVVPAERCLALGLVNRMVPHDQLGPETLAWAARLAALPPVAAGLTKMAVYEKTRDDLNRALSMEEEHQDRCFRSQDALEGFASFSEKRAARFEGR